MPDLIAGNFATARKGGFAQADIDFIRAKRRAGFPDTAIANMMSRPVHDVRLVGDAVQIRTARNEYRVRPEPVRGTLAYAVWKASKLTGISEGDILGKSRLSHIVAARHLAFWLARGIKREDGSHAFSLPRIARHFKRDHTSIMHGIRKIEAERGPA